MAVEKDSKKFSKGNFEASPARFHLLIAKITSKKQAALRPNTQLGETKRNANPPNAGPIIPETFSWRPLNVEAEGNSSFVTISGTIAVQAGALKAKPTPVRKIQINTRAGVNQWNVKSTASRAAAAASQKFMKRRSLRRSTMSAKAPAGKVKRKKGRETTVDIQERQSADGPTMFMTHAAVVCLSL